ncbi:MAG: NAD(P)/FAD-dependent oxidoreductase [Planctomycetaceae bacterium]
MGSTATDWDAVVVGGGPAGSTCAGRLRGAGLNVLILDKQSFPRDKTCAGWVTPQVFETLGIDPQDYAATPATAGEGCQSPRTLQPITGFRTGLIGGAPIETHYGRIVSYGIRRCEFDDVLLRRSGAATQLGRALKSCTRHGDAWTINDGLRTPLLIGAGGHFCPVARRQGAREVPGTSVVAAQEIEFAPAARELEQCGAQGAVPELYFCNDLKGYGWCFRKGAYLNIGLGRVDGTRVAEHVAAFCDYLREIGSVTCEIPKGFHGHAYQLYERTQPRLVDDGVLLIGDAAGLAYPQSGEGIRPAVESAILAAQAVIGAGGNYSRAGLGPYAVSVQERFGTPRRRSAADWLPASWLRFAAARLMTNHAIARRVVIDRWFLHAQQPALRA